MPTRISSSSNTPSMGNWYLQNNLEVREPTQVDTSSWIISAALFMLLGKLTAQLILIREWGLPMLLLPGSPTCLFRNMTSTETIWEAIPWEEQAVMEEQR